MRSIESGGGMKTEKLRNIIISVIILCILAVLGYVVYLSVRPDETKEKNTQITTHKISEDKNEIHKYIIVEKNGLYGFADTEGKTVLEPKFDMASLADYGLYYVKHGKTSGFLNENLESVFKSEQTTATNVSEDFVIYTHDEKYGFINIRTGSMIEAEYETAYDFSEGLAGITKDGKLGFIDTAGNIVIEPKYSSKGLNYFKEGKCYVRDSDGVPGYYIDKSGNKAIDNSFGYGMPFYENRAFVKEGDSWYIIDETGNLVFDRALGEYKETVPGRFADGKATVMVDNKYGVIDADGNFVIYPDFEELLTLSGGCVVFKKDGKYGYMKADGTVIIKPIYDYLGSFRHGLSAFGFKDKQGVVKSDGTEILAAEYKRADVLDNGLVKITEDNNKFFYIDSDGNIIRQSK